MSATLTFNLNGEDIVIEDVDLLAPLANTIREKTGMTGTKVACGQGNCRDRLNAIRTYGRYRSFLQLHPMQQGECPECS